MRVRAGCERVNVLIGALRWLLPAACAALLAVPIKPSGASSEAGLMGAIDQPAADLPVSGTLDVVGWALDNLADQGTGVDRVTISVDDTYVKDASYGDPRVDIGGAFGPRFSASGLHASLDIQTLASPGDHVLSVRAHSAVSDQWSTLNRPIQVLGAPRFCVNTHPLWFDLAKAATDFDRVRGSGLSAIRFDVSWDRLEPNSRGDWNQSYLAKLDGVLGLLAERGARPILTILGTPAWARSRGTAATPPDDATDFADVAAFLAARYASLPGMTYEIWNEPNSPVFWDSVGGPDAAAYAGILRAAYARIKAAAPAATVLGGSTAFNDPDYLTAMFASGAGGALDGLSLHPYSRGYAPDDTSVPSRSFTLGISQAEQVLADHGDMTTPIWITEMGWSTAQVSDAVRADYYRRAVQLVRTDTRVAAFCAFELNQGEDSTGPETGLIAPSGAPTTSWDAYRLAALGK